MKLTTDRHEASHGLCATVELLVTDYSGVRMMPSYSALYRFSPHGGIEYRWGTYKFRDFLSNWNQSSSVVCLRLELISLAYGRHLQDYH